MLPRIKYSILMDSIKNLNIKLSLLEKSFVDLQNDLDNLTLDVSSFIYDRNVDDNSYKLPQYVFCRICGAIKGHSGVHTCNILINE